MSCSINMTSESWISFCTRGKHVFLNPTFLSKSFHRNIMIIIISFSSYCRALLPEHIPLHYSDIWRQGQLLWLNFSLFFHYHIYQEQFLTNTKHSNTSFAPFGSSYGRRIHSCLRIHYKDNLSYKLSFLETKTHNNIYSVGFHELRWLPILKWVFAY